MRFRYSYQSFISLARTISRLWNSLPTMTTATSLTVGALNLRSCSPAGRRSARITTLKSSEGHWSMAVLKDLTRKKVVIMKHTLETLNYIFRYPSNVVTSSFCFGLLITHEKNPKKTVRLIMSREYRTDPVIYLSLNGECSWVVMWYDLSGSSEGSYLKTGVAFTDFIEKSFRMWCFSNEKCFEGIKRLRNHRKFYFSIRTTNSQWLTFLFISFTISAGLTHPT